MAQRYLRVGQSLEQYRQRYTNLTFSSFSNLDAELKRRLDSFSETLTGKGKKANGKSARKWEERIELFDRQVLEFTELIKSSFSSEYLTDTRLIDNYLESVRDLVDITFSNNMYIQRKYKTRFHELESARSSLYSKVLSSKENLNKYASLIHQPSSNVEVLCGQSFKINDPKLLRPGQFHTLSFSNNGLEFGLVSNTPITERDRVILFKKNSELGLDNPRTFQEISESQTQAIPDKEASPKPSYLRSLLRDAKESANAFLRLPSLKYACLTLTILTLSTLKLNDTLYAPPDKDQSSIETLIAESD